MGRGVAQARQARQLGLLYLENNLSVGTFSAHTLTVLELLAAQAAISLASAQLYANLQQENAERKEAESERVFTRLAATVARELRRATL